MIEENLFFKTLEDVKSFVNVAMLKDYELDFISGKYVVNAKSIMGIFSLDLTKPVKLVAHTDDESLKGEIAPFIYVEKENA
ncbi:MAG: HPr family phosphocarrier protein [Oscillospiraceae bacterium]|nr:HPr family phosphocarrier protein [Candidatus Equicaccousia limihippi]